MGSAIRMDKLEIGMDYLDIGMDNTQAAPCDVVTTADSLATMATRVNTNRVNTRNSAVDVASAGSGAAKPSQSFC